MSVADRRRTMNINKEYIRKKYIRMCKKVVEIQDKIKANRRRRVRNEQRTDTKQSD